MEQWAEVIGYEGRYEISSLGRVRALRRIVMRNGHPLTMPERMMTISPHCETGYNLVRLSKSATSSRLHRVSRLVCRAFHGPDNGRHAAHRNGDRQDDRADNLSWLTRAENESDKLIHGTRYFGIDVHNAKLDKAQVLKIRSLRVLGKTYREIASNVGCNFEAVRGVIARGTYPEFEGA